MSSEAIYFTIYNMVLSQIGIVIGLFFFTFVVTIFIYILFSNLIGLVPYNFATTAHIATTLSLSFTI
jgi:F0F1-type ATP synthase membrane subunit a